MPNPEFLIKLHEGLEKKKVELEKPELDLAEAERWFSALLPLKKSALQRLLILKHMEIQDQKK
jgi:uncharacterized protein YhaN